MTGARQLGNAVPVTAGQSVGAVWAARTLRASLSLTADALPKRSRT